MVDTKAGRFIGSLVVFQLPFDSFIAWGVSSMHRDEDCDVVQLGQSTKNVANLFLNSAKRISWCLEVVQQDKAGLLRGIEFRNDFFKRNLLISIFRQVPVVGCTGS